MYNLLLLKIIIKKQYPQICFERDDIWSDLNIHFVQIFFIRIFWNLMVVHIHLYMLFLWQNLFIYLFCLYVSLL